MNVSSLKLPYATSCFRLLYFMPASSDDEEAAAEAYLLTSECDHDRSDRDRHRRATRVGSGVGLIVFYRILFSAIEWHY